MTEDTLDLSDATIEDTSQRLALIEARRVRDRQWCLVDVAMRLSWLAAQGEDPRRIAPLLRRFRAAERAR